MEGKNFTGDEHQKTNKEVFCSAELIGEVYNHLIFHLVLQICLSIIAFLGNTLILVALHKESSLFPTSKLLYRNLAITDLCVGIIVQPVSVTRLVAAMNKQWNTCRYALYSAYTTSFILCSVSLLTLTAISVDRLLALLLGLRYRQVVTLKRMHVTVAVFWAVSIVGTTIHFWNLFITLWFCKICVLLCLVTTIFCYIRIFLTLRHNRQNREQNQVQPNQAISLNIARYRKALSNAQWVQVTLVVCYLPYGLVAAIMTQRELSLSFYLARQYTTTLIYLNSSLNPLIYCWKIREVRQAVKDTIRQFCCSSS